MPELSLPLPRAATAAPLQRVTGASGTDAKVLQQFVLMADMVSVSRLFSSLDPRPSRRAAGPRGVVRMHDEGGPGVVFVRGDVASGVLIIEAGELLSRSGSCGLARRALLWFEGATKRR